MFEEDEYKSIGRLFKDATDGAGLQTVYTLVRAEGWEHRPDPIIALNTYLSEVRKGLTESSTTDQAAVLNRLISEHEIYCLIFNLVGNALGETYKINPLPAVSGFGADADPSRDGEHLELLLEKIRQYEQANPVFSGLMVSILEGIRGVYRRERVFSADVDTNHITRMVELLFHLTNKYFRVLKVFSNNSNIFFPSKSFFSVFELLIDSETGLCGFVFHHSNGSRSLFRRYPDRTIQESYTFSDHGEIIPVISPGGQDSPYWVVNNRPFYELGYPGRYNVVGEWKPLLYPGPSEFIQSDIRAKTETESDKRVPGCLLYIMATCHHAIEFVVQANAEIPGNFLSSTMDEMKIVLQKVKMPNAYGSNENTQVYDGTLYIKDISVEGIKGALDAIGLFLNRLAFRLDARVDWKLKYTIYESSSGKLHLNEKQFDALGKFMTASYQPDGYLLDTAMGWYNTAKHAKNIFTEFLNYYIGFESLAIPLASGELGRSEKFGIEKMSREERRRRTNECIAELHNAEYENDPRAFVEKAYFECTQTLNAKTRLALTKVFGEDDERTLAFFDATDGKSIYQLRNDLAHGNSNHIDRDHAIEVEKKLPILKDIVFDFIMRVSLGPDTKFQKFNSFSMTFSMQDPRTTMIATSLQHFPNQEWKMKWEWLN